MAVYLVGAGPGDPGLLTRRGAELLAAADVVVYDRLVDPSLLLLARREAVLVDVGKQPAPPGVLGARAPSAAGANRQEDVNRLLVAHGRAGRTVVRLKGGDPFLFGRGGEEAQALAAAGVEWEVVPGVTSAVAVPACAGVPVTHRGLSTSLTVVTGHVGDPSAPGGVDWDALAQAGGTLVVLMGMANRAEIARRLIEAGRPPSTPVAVVEWGTTPGQRTARTVLDRLGEVTLGSPAVIVIGAVAGLDLGPAAGRPLDGRSVVVTRRPEQAGGLSGALGRAGARVVELPVIDIGDPEDAGEALGRAVQRVSRYAWVVFTSANAVARFLARLPDARALGGVRIAAVGTATAQALVAARLVPDLVPERPTGAGLVAAFPDPPGDARRSATVLFPAAADARREVPEGLRAKGWVVDEVTAYRTVAAPAPPDEVVDVLAAADAVTFASPSAVRAYLSARTAGGHPLPVPPVVGCIGPVTAAAAGEAGLAEVVQAASPDPSAMVEALSAAFAARGTGGAGSAGAAAS